MATKVGDILWQTSIDDETGKVEWDRYYVRTIRKGQAAGTLMHAWTCKEKTKFGKVVSIEWTKKTIPNWCRQYWQADQKPRLLRTTKLQALYLAIRDHKPEFYDDPAIAEKVLKTLRSMVKREKKKIQERKNG